MMRNVSLLPALVAALFLLSIVRNGPAPVSGAYPNLLNHTGCLYAYMSDGGKYEVTVPESTDHPKGTLQKFSYDAKSACITEKNPGLLVINFDFAETDDNNFASMSIEFELNAVPKEYNWEISKATLKIQPNNKQMFPVDTFELKSASGDIYAGAQQSYSCSSLVLVNRVQTGNQFKITLKRFQVQPFHEPGSTVFASSRDCSVWLTLPQIMGLLLMLFIIMTVLIGVYLLVELGGHSSDLRFSKQGGMLMNQAQLDATKAD